MSDALDPGQRFAITAIEASSRLFENEVNICWVPEHSRASGNEVADEYSKAAASGSASGEEIPDGYRQETSLSYMTRDTTESKPRETTEWISEHVRGERRYRPPPGRVLRDPGTAE